MGHKALCRDYKDRSQFPSTHLQEALSALGHRAADWGSRLLICTTASLITSAQVETSILAHRNFRTRLKLNYVQT